MIAKVIELKENVEVIVKKTIIDDMFGITCNFVAEMEDKSQVNISTTAKYGLEEMRDKDFNGLDKTLLTTYAKNLKGFNHIMK